MSGSANALILARASGRPVPIPGGNGLVANPNGTVGPPANSFGRPTLPVPPIPPAVMPAAVQPVAPSAPFTAAGVAGLPGSPSGPAVAPPPASLLQQPSQITNQPVGSTVTWPPWPVGSGSAPAPQTQPPLNQANPNFTAGIPGLPGSPSGPAVAPPGGFQPPSVVPPAQLPDLVVSAHRYRAQHGLATQDDTDALNAESLAAAQAGRNYFNPQLAAQYGQPQAAGAYGPRTDVVNALTMPPSNG